MAKVLKIGTHSGVFHCDEVLACFMLKKLPEYKDAEIVRTRDLKLLDSCDIVVDVGGVYDPSKHRYDHHQRDFKHTMNSLVPSRPWTITLSSAGLIYHHFGERILGEILGHPENPKLVTKCFNFVYNNFIQEIDGLDNGVPMYDGEPKYRISTHLGARVHNLNPSWNASETEDPMKLFENAMQLVGTEFVDRVNYFNNSWWPARKLVEEALENRFQIHESGEILLLQECCPWKEHLVQLEQEAGLSGIIKFIIFNSESWRVQAIPVQPDSFVCRIFLHADWRGLRDEELSKVSGIENCVFVHASGFIGGNRTKEGAITMAVKSLEAK